MRTDFRTLTSLSLITHLIRLVDFYFDVSVGTHRFLHRQAVMSWLNAMQINVLSGLSIWSNLGEAKAAIVLTILAISVAQQEKKWDTSRNQACFPTPSHAYFSEATLLTGAETSLPRLESAQTRLMQVVYLLHTSRMNYAWYICLVLLSRFPR